MTASLRVSLLCALILGCASLGAPAVEAAESAESTGSAEAPPVDFAKDIAPMLAKNCIACHNAKTAEGGLNLESRDALLGGGDSGPAIAVKSVDESYLLARVTGREEPLMPPEDNAVGAQPLTEPQIELLRRWIAAGAPASQSADRDAIAWNRLADTLHPIYAMACADDGGALAVGRGNTVELAHAWSDERAGVSHRLIDPELRLADGEPLQATHLDLVQSLAFSPDSQWLASGGYRAVKLWHRRTAPRELLTGLAANATAVAFAPSGARVATSQGRALELVDVDSRQSHRFLRAHSDPIECLVWLDDDRVLSCDGGGVLVITDAATLSAVDVAVEQGPLAARSLAMLDSRSFGIAADGRLFELLLDDPAEDPVRVSARVRWLGLEGEVHCMAATSVPAPQLLIALAGGSVRAIDPDSAETIREYPVEGETRSLAISPDGTALVVLGDGPARVLRVDDGQALATLDRDYASSRRLAVAHRDAERQQGFVDTLAAQLPELQKAHEAEIESQKKVQEARDKAAELVATRAGEVTAAQAAVVEADKALAEAKAHAEVHAEKAAIAAQAAAAEAMKQIEAMEAEVEKKKKAVEEAEAQRVQADNDLAGREQALAAANDSTRVAQARIPELELRIADEKARLEGLRGSAEELRTAASPPVAVAGRFSPDGSTLLVACADGTPRLYAVDGGEPRANLADAPIQVTALHAATDGSMLAVDASGRLLAWDIGLPWDLQRTIGSAEQSPISDRVTALDFSPDGRLLAVGSGPPSRAGEVHLFDTSTGELVRSLSDAHSDTVLAVAFSPDGRTLASGGADKLARLWDVESGEMLRALEGHTHHVLAIAWQDNGQRLATASADMSVKLWKTATAEQERTLSGFAKEVTAVAFVGQTSQLVTAAADSIPRLYNGDDGKQVRTYSGAQDALFNLAIPPDGGTILSAGQAGRVWTWNLDDGKLLGTLYAE